jgi:hypothetical protein
MKPALKKGGKAAKRPRDVVGVFCGIPKSRLAESQILQFERLLSVADSTSQAYFDLKSTEKKRRTQCEFGTPHVKVGFDDDGGDEDAGGEKEKTDYESINRALVNTISVLTSTPAPGRIANTAEASKFAKDALLTFKETIVEKVRLERHNHTLTSKQQLEAMQLMSNLNSILSENR